MRKNVFLAISLGVAVLAATPFVNSFDGGQWVQAAAFRDRWGAEDLRVLASLRLSQLPAAPTDPSNAVENSRAAVELGKRLFNDARFSRNQAVSCASCHDPQKQFQDGLPLSRGIGVGSRRAMPIVGSGHSPWLFWDGRKDSLWSQALGPLEDEVEHGGNRANFAHLMQAHYRPAYEAVFRALPDLSAVPQDAGPSGKPAEKAAWNAMSDRARADVNRVFANMGKAIAAYEKTLIHGESRFDRYVEATIAGNPSGQQHLTPQEVKGLRLFLGKGQCVSCHNGPLFTDQHFHNTGVLLRLPTNPDRGRALGIAKVLKDEFNCLGPYSDATPEQCQELQFIAADDPAMDGAFKTPGLRGVSTRPPYMHAGQFASLEEVLAHYVKAPRSVVGHSELAHGGGGNTERQRIRLSAQDIRDLAAFLGTLSGPVTETPARSPVAQH